MADDAEQLVAVDLGSNSFHMVIARKVDGQVTILDRMRERVQLAAGFDDRGHLTPEAQTRGLECLRRFGQRLRAAGGGLRVRAVGTNTLRKARNARDFLRKAATALGHPVEVISGREEARLIYLGVAHTLANGTGRRLVVDIGGGSTELIIGEKFDTKRAESLHMGCIGYTQLFFSDGRLRRESFRDATTAALVELETIETAFAQLGWSQAVGSSGTMTSIEAILRANGWGDSITRDGLRTLRETLIGVGRLAKVALPGLSQERLGVLPGGLAILIGVFKSLKIDRMATSGGALREGLLYDTIGRIRHEDVRDRTIEWMSDRFAVDRGQAARVETVACKLLDQAAAAWDLQAGELRSLLSWAARLHEIGLALSYSGHHTHGAYLVANSDMPGFAREQQAYLAALIGAHRRRLRPERLAELRAIGGPSAVRLAVLLRIATTLTRSRDPQRIPAPTLSVGAASLKLRFPERWLAKHPMTEADLQNEQAFLAQSGLALTFE